ncbi:hypothetical protein OG426_18550 [Streptomyces canus]|uniref:hypothetical protein n=1 Tax=Streptomyces canus TaxID=58343 RepID=UPI0022569A35|nr:hypothetical protein [Streptomyces canus]MCX4860447.1 hypothetical protein [Streptomyces canus]WSW34345.1 hypothetical protein OG426_18550 [Streptomyces canus]
MDHLRSRGEYGEAGGPSCLGEPSLCLRVLVDESGEGARSGQHELAARRRVDELREEADRIQTEPADLTESRT